MAEAAGERPQQASSWLTFFPRISAGARDVVDERNRPPKWNMGILNDRQTIEVPGIWNHRHRLADYTYSSAI